MSYLNPIKWWNQMNAHWLDIPHVWVVKYQELLQEPEITLDQYLGNHKKQQEFQIARNIINPSDHHLNLSETPFDLSKYQKENYMLGYSEQDIQWVEQNVDRHVISRIGLDN